MGIVSSYLSYYFTRTDDPDSVTGLTSRDRYWIQTSWAPVKKDLVGSGEALLIMYFKKYPEDINHFPFRDIPIDKLKGNKKFQAHCSSVMHAIDSLVESLEDSELLVNLLEKIGKSHGKRNIIPESFNNLKAVTLELFSTFMSKDVVKIWEKMLNVAFGVIINNL